MTNEQTRSLLSDHEQLRSARAPWEGHWQDIRDLVRPSADEIRRMNSPGKVRTGSLFDSTAVDSCEELAGGLQSFLMSPAERWFSLRVAGTPDALLDHPAKLWLDDVSDAIYREFQSPRTRFNLAASEGFLDLVSYGTTAMLVEWDKEERSCIFRTSSTGQFWIRENSKGKVDTIHIAYRMTLRQLIQRFGEESIPEKVLKAPNDPGNPHRDYEVIHIIRPRKDRNIRSFAATQKPFASFWLLRDGGHLLNESGYESFPYMVSRWLKSSDEEYGRSPALKTLSDIKMLNAMARTFIKVSQKVVDPPLVVPNDGFMLPIATHPGALIFKEPGTEQIEQLPSGEQNLPITWEVLKGQQDKVRRGFYADWLKLEKDNKEMTAFEVQDRREEKLRFLAPMLGRQETELLGPLIGRVYDLLLRHRVIEPPPASLSGVTLKIEYVSPAAKAQQGIKAINMSRYLQDILPLAEASPGILDVIDFDKYSQEMALLRHVPRMILRSPEAIEEIRAQKAQMEQMQQMAQVAEPASKAMKNIAEAQQVI